MRVGYGWPKVLSTEPANQRSKGDAAGFGHIKGLCALQTYIVVAFQAAVQLWSGQQHRVCLSTFQHTRDAIESEGENEDLTSSQLAQRCVLLTSRSHLHIYRIGAKRADEVLPAALFPLSSTLQPAKLILTHTLDLREHGIATALAADAFGIGVSFESGRILSTTWMGHLRGHTSVTTLLEEAGVPSSTDPAAAGTGPAQQLEEAGCAPGPPRDQHPFVHAFVMHENCSRGVVLLSDGRALLLALDSEGLAAAAGMQCLGQVLSDGLYATCGALAPQPESVALGALDGVVRIVPLQPHDPDASIERRVTELSLLDWGYGPEDTGAVAVVSWTPDAQALAVGYQHKGFSVWTPSGCRVFSSMRTSPQAQLPGGVPPAGVYSLCWTVSGLGLLLDAQDRQLAELQFAKPATCCSHLPKDGVISVVATPVDEIHVLHGEDRLLLVREQLEPLRSELLLPPEDMEVLAGESNDLEVCHVLLPHAYMAANWPLRLVAVSDSTLDIAAAGSRGLLLYDCRRESWRMFEDVAQERAFSAVQMAWLGDVLAVAKKEANGDGHTCKLVLHSRFFLDQSAELGELALPQEPIALDCRHKHALLLFNPLHIQLLRIQPRHASQPRRPAKVQITCIRELHLATPPPAVMSACLISNRATAADEPAKNGSLGVLMESPSLPMSPSGTQGSTRNATSGWGRLGSPEQTGTAAVSPLTLNHAWEELQAGSNWRAKAPRHCAILRWGGLFSVLDLETGIEQHLLNGVECAWLSSWVPPGPPVPLPLLPSTKDLGRSVFDGSSGAPSPQPSARGTSGAMPALSSSSPPPPQLPKFPDPVQQAQPGHVEMPWWLYCPDGIKLVFPSELEETGTAVDTILLPGTAVQTAVLDQELQFDREVLPIGISLADVAIIGVTQRVSKSPAMLTRDAAASTTELAPASVMASYALHLTPMPQSQPVLPCLLRRLLMAGRVDGARTIAGLHQHGPHFCRSLEWLLFTTLEHDFLLMDERMESRSDDGVDLRPAGSTGSRRARSCQLAGEGGPRSLGRLLKMAFELVQAFSHWPVVVVNVSRKTDATMWPLLFSVVGKPSKLLQHLLCAGQVHTASCLLVVVDSVEGADVAHTLALSLVAAAMQAYLCDLSAELLRFLYPACDLQMDAFLEPQGRSLLQTPSLGPDTHRNSLDNSRRLHSLDSEQTGLLTSLLPFGDGAISTPPADAQQLANGGVSNPAMLPETEAAPEKPDASGDATASRSWYSFFFGTSTAGAAPMNASGAGAVDSPEAGKDDMRDSRAVYAAGSTPHAQNTTAAAVDESPLQQLRIHAERTRSGIMEGPHSAAAAMHARRIIASHAWKWLADMNILALADLQRALAPVPCSLAALMQLFPGESQQPLSSNSVLEAVGAVRQQLQYDEQPALLATAHDLLLLFHYIAAPNWRLAMALCLNQQTHMQQLRLRAPKVWQEVRASIMADESMRDLRINFST